ncbi:Rne/Rng family ribonuclease [Marinicrinis lubricantis]|uniref:Rne/Rng family ribonuclease n=1 Tax=Marinicrinis lubricantis TaxID=2086470 RepID=A0ABW1ITW1_9BACL
MKRIVVRCEQDFTKVALMEQDRLVEYAAERGKGKPTVGNIYKGKVVNVLPGMEAAFVDIGLGKNAFIYIDDLLPAHLEKQPKVKPSIDELIAPGQDLLVQVIKEAIGGKGAKVTTHFSLPGRWLVYMPNADYVGVSRKISSDAERERLRSFGERMRQNDEGVILRTAAEHETEEFLEKDLFYLRERWSGIVKRSQELKSPAEVYRELDVLPRIVRDLFTEEVEEMVVDEAKTAKEIAAYIGGFAPRWKNRVKVDRSGEDIFVKFGVQDELDKLFRQKVRLDNGASLHIDHTEALTVVDVNTGKFTGSVDLEETVFQTNLQAAEMIARLLRVRDIGGIIIVDFIDMRLEEHQEKVLQMLEEHMKEDRTKSTVVGWTKLGLLEITRKKARESSALMSLDVCHACQGTGRVPMH